MKPCSCLLGVDLDVGSVQVVSLDVGEGQLCRSHLELVGTEVDDGHLQSAHCCCEDLASVVGCVVEKEDSVGPPVGVLSVQLQDEFEDEEENSLAVVGPTIDSAEEFTSVGHAKDQRDSVHSVGGCHHCGEPPLLPRVLASIRAGHQTLVDVDDALHLQSRLTNQRAHLGDTQEEDCCLLPVPHASKRVHVGTDVRDASVPHSQLDLQDAPDQCHGYFEPMTSEEVALNG